MRRATLTFRGIPKESAGPDYEDGMLRIHLSSGLRLIGGEGKIEGIVWIRKIFGQ
jgi:hypothetical protein